MRWSILAFTAVCCAFRPVTAQDTLGVQRLAGADTNQQDWFGYSVDLQTVGDEMLALIGAARAGGLSTGAGYVFRLDTGSGQFLEEARLSEPGFVGQGEDVALLPPLPGSPGAAGRWLAVVGGGQVGRLYRLQGTGTWAYVARLHPPGNTYEYGGRAAGVARDASGAEYVALSESDSLFVFRRAPGAPDDVSGWLLDGGFSVVPSPGLSLERGMLAMWAGLDGAVRLAFPVATNPRAVLVFARDPATGTWAEETRLFGSALLPGHRFGHASVAGRVMTSGAEGETEEFVLVGAPWREQPSMAGQAYLFRRDTAAGTWVEDALLEAPPGAGGFGLGGSMDDGVIVVSGGNRFWTYVQLETGNWTQTGFVETFQTYGGVVDRTGTALSQPYLVMADYLNEDLGFQAGAAWVLTLPGSLTPAEAPPAVAGLALETPTPHPVRGRAIMRYAIPAPAAVVLTMHDALGRTVWRHAAPPAAAGRHAVRLDTGPLAAGVYVLRLAAGGVAVARRVVVAR